MRPAYQERVFEELNELHIRRGKLGEFIKHKLSTVPVDERRRLVKQFAVMGDYEDVLRDRVANFPKEEAPA